MEPLLHDGDAVLIAPGASVQVGDVVIAKHPYQGVDVVKQVAEIDSGAVTLWSPSGNDSRSFGTVDRERLIGVVTFDLSNRVRVVGLERVVT